MQVVFYKMHGAGNDFVVLDARARPLDLSPGGIVRLADRHTGIGFDQLVLIEPGDAEASIGVRFFNTDGTESAACGNGSRCAASLVGTVPGDTLTLRTRSGLLPARLLGGDQVEIGMGHPGVGWQDVPLSHELDTLHLPLDGDPAACSIGNPHATFFDSALDPAIDGPRLEWNPLFPAGANIGFADILSRERIALRVFERGSGLTLACGSGACAAAVNAARRGLTGRRVQVEMPGGTLSIDWDDTHGVRMTGPAKLSFTGSIDLL